MYVKATISKETIAFLYGRLYERLYSQCQGFAESIKLPGPEIAQRMGALLNGEEIRNVLGKSDRVLMRRTPTKETKGERTKMEVGVRPRKKPRISPWAKFDTPAKRSKEMARRLALRKNVA